MISVTGGFNQQYMGAEIKVAKEKFARDSMNNFLDAVSLYAFATNLDKFADSLVMSDGDVELYAFGTNLAITGDAISLADAIELYVFAESLNLEGDFFEMLDAIGVSLTIQHFNETIGDSFELLDAVETNLAEVE